MSDLENGYKINKYFYMDSNQKILKYKKYCIISNCEKNASFNYEDLRNAIYCDTHKLKKMINVKKSDVDKHNCLLCNKYISKEHFFTKEHIDKFKKYITIKTRNSIKKKFVDIIIDFHIIDKNVFYKDLYFKDYLKKMIVKNCDNDKNYKISLYKFNQALLKNNDIKYWVEKYILQNIDDIDNIDKLKIKNNRNDLDLINITDSEIANYNAEDNLEELNILSMHEDYDSSIMTIQNSRLIVKISECDIFSAGNKIDKIPEIFFKKRNLLIMKNDDDKCFLYCCVRKFKNVITSKAFRITKRDLLITEEIMEECNMDFDNVSLDELDKIENLLKVNIHIFGCDKNFNSKKIIRKSKSDFDKDLDLLLIDDIKHYILIKNINKFISDNSHVIKTCRNCLNVFYSEIKYKEHIEYCKFRKPKKLMPSFKKDMGFENLKNCILNNWVIHSDFECIIDPITKEHSFIAGGYYLECRNNKFSKKVQTFYDLKEYTISLVKELVYIDDIESNYLQNEIDYNNFNQEEFDNVKFCKYCKSEFNHPYNDRHIILYEICDKEKLKYVLENNDFNKEVNTLARNYYDSLDNDGCKRIVYKQTCDKNRYYGDSSCLTYLKKEIRNSIMPKNIKDIDMVNAHPVILNYLCKKNNVDCNILKNYIENRELILSSFGEDRKIIKELFLTVLNGGFKDIYSDDKQTDNYLKLFEQEITKIQNYFYTNDKRYSDIDYNFKGKNLSRVILDVENQILQIMINYFISKNVNILTLEYDGLKIYTDRNSKHFSINELELNIYKNIGINMKLTFKNIEDSFSDFGIRCNTDSIKHKNIIENKIKVIHHDHCLEKNNIIGYICRECNLQIKNNKTIPIYFFNGTKYDNTIILKSICDIFKNDVTLNVIGNSCESFKMIDFKFKKIKYSLKLLDMCNFIKGSLNDLSKNLNDENKIVTREHFPYNFELMKYKVCFPYEFITKENIYNEELPSIEDFYSSLKLDNISEEDYDKTLEIYEKLNCKSIKEYLDIYLKLDICLQTDVFNVFRKCIWDKFEIDCSKYITSCSLSLDLMLKYTGVKIELIRDISIFDFVNSSILGGVCIASQNIADNKDGVISSCDVVSLYPYVMSKKLPISNYKFVKYFNRDRYLDSDYGCLLNCEIYTTDKVKNNSILKQYPALISKTSVKYDDLSEFQRKNLKNNYKSSDKLITHLGYDKNAYLSFEMYEMMISLGYEINVKKILEYKHNDFMKPYIDFLFEKKSYYKKNRDIGMSNTFKILANSLFGVMMTRCEKFKDFKIVTKKSQVDKQIKKPNFSCRNIINENLAILEMEKTSVVYKYPILIGSIILQNSKVHMFNYLYEIYPRLFGNYEMLYQDTDSIYAKLNISHDEYLKILEENKDLFGDSIIGQMEPEPECIDNPIKEFIALSSKCYSYICEKEIKNNKNKLKYNVVHAKGISDSYKVKNIDHNLFKKTLLENMKPDKISFNNISVKNQQIKTNTIVKNNIEFLNDKRYIPSVNENIPHTLYVN